VQAVRALFNPHAPVYLNARLQTTKRIKDTLQFTGKAIVEDFDYARVFLGKVSVTELRRLMDAHGDQLLERNIRCFLGLHGNRVNQAGLESTFVLVRLYQIPRESSSFVQTITYATNSQNPVDLRDLRANDDRQKSLELSMKDLGFSYHCQRAEGALRPNDISVGTAAEAVLSVWRRRPQQAKFCSGEHFGELYADIFTPTLNGSQVVLAVLLFRIAENKRKRPPIGAPEFVRYASCFAAMLMGTYLLEALGVSLPEIDHRNFKKAHQCIEENGDAYFERAVDVLAHALRQLYGNKDIGLLRLSATFRRGDLFQYLPLP